ncbi:ATP-dependent RNA helicase MAK5 [Kwoniella heveanensis CBS 569]|nr:ATP-dependent RNA helicase MAK5 [Kwoniella heveanensis CBS 569]
MPKKRSTSTSKSRTRLAAESLKWKPVHTSSFSGVDGGGGMMMLEELEDVGIEWEEDVGGRKVARFVASETKGKGKAKAAAEGSLSGDEVIDEGEADEGEEANEGGNELPEVTGIDAQDLNDEDEESIAESLEEVEDEPEFDDALLPDWKDINLHSSLKRAFLASGFVKPTEIQKRALPAAIAGRDVVGVAETGSGKTLSYSLPILSHLLRCPKPSPSSRRPLSGLILCPTRELALQVVEHLSAVLKHALAEGQGTKPSGPPRISVGSVVGGLSAQKQKRILDRGCDVLVATPGRLWDLIKADDELAASIRGLRFLVIDEADRMIENGHFAELENIVRLTQRAGATTQGPDDDDPVFAAMSTLLTEAAAKNDMQTFVFSATLSKDLQQNLKRTGRIGGKGKGKRSSTLEDLVDKLDFRDRNPEVIDLSPEGGVVATLRESIVECVVADKDLYLYYFLLRYPGRSLVFVGSIDGIRRLIPLFTLLQLPIFPLHSQLQQKQRLKNLDRFKSSKNGILIATDVAARGLDIPQVDHVIHFNLPRTADAYIHRSGRTARAKNQGFALQLCAPEEKGMQRALMKSLGRGHELPDLSIESGFLPALRERIRVARAIEKAEHHVTKSTHDRNWLIEAAEAMDLDIDPDMLSDAEDDPDLPFHKPNRGKKANKKVDVSGLKAELRQLLSEKLMARGVSAKYPTSGSKIIVDDLLRETGHATLLGAGTKKAYDEVDAAKGKRKRAAKSRSG